MKEFTELKTRKVRYKCDWCNDGYYEPTGICLTSCPPQYPHKCSNCGINRNFLVIYPLIETKEIVT